MIVEESIDNLKYLPLPESDKREFVDFCKIGSNRFDLLTRSLNRRDIPYEVIPIENSRHIALLAPNAGELERHYYRVTFTAHYDRAAGSPGANDNSAAVFQLLSYWEDMRQNGVKHNTQVLFTDKEELTSGMTATDQGIWQLARHMKRLKISNILFFVLDMCGIGDTPVWGRSIHKVNIKPGNDPISRAHEAMETFLIRNSHGIDYGVHPEFSDDLGLLLGGYPAIRLSLLPREEANKLFQNFAKTAMNTDTTKDALPPSWHKKHSPDDNLQSLEPRAFNLMKRLLREIAHYRFPCL